MTEAQLVAAHAPEVRRQARGLGWNLPGAEFDDLLQEGLIGLLLAARSFDPGKGMPFHRFAHMCARRAMVTALKTANRQKQRPLNESSRGALIDDPAEGYREIRGAEGFPDPKAEIPRRVENREALRAVLRASAGLSQLEARALLGFAQGYAYAELGPLKQVDNAIQRGREKLRAAA